MSEQLQPDQPQEHDVEVHTVARVVGVAWPKHTLVGPAVERTERQALRVVFMWPDKTGFWQDTLYYPN